MTGTCEETRTTLLIDKNLKNDKETRLTLGLNEVIDAGTLLLLRIMVTKAFPFLQGV